MNAKYDTFAIDCNSKELHDKLEELGYVPLQWTVSNFDDRRTVLTSSYKPKCRFAYWSTGESVETLKTYKDVFVCETEEEFLKYAKENVEK